MSTTNATFPTFALDSVLVAGVSTMMLVGVSSIAFVCGCDMQAVSLVYALDRFYSFLIVVCFISCVESMFRVAVNAYGTIRLREYETVVEKLRLSRDVYIKYETRGPAGPSSTRVSLFFSFTTVMVTDKQCITGGREGRGNSEQRRVNHC